MAYEYDVFISYSRFGERGKWVQTIFHKYLREELIDALGRRDVRIFLDIDEIRTGEQWANKLGRALATSKCLVPVYTGDYFESEWCMREFFAMYHRSMQTLDQTNGTRTLLCPILLSDGQFMNDQAKTLNYKDFKSFCLPVLTLEGLPEKMSNFVLQLREWVNQDLVPIIQQAPEWSANWEQEWTEELFQQYFRKPKEINIDNPTL